MNELKRALQAELRHVNEVWFDINDNWYIHRVPSAIKSMTRDEVLSLPEDTGEIADVKTKKTKKSNSEDTGESQN